jgi:hypothetical protein
MKTSSVAQVVAVSNGRCGHRIQAGNKKITALKKKKKFSGRLATYSICLPKHSNAPGIPCGIFQLCRRCSVHISSRTFYARPCRLNISTYMLPMQKTKIRPIRRLNGIWIFHSVLVGHRYMRKSLRLFKAAVDTSPFLISKQRCAGTTGFHIELTGLGDGCQHSTMAQPNPLECPTYMHCRPHIIIVVMHQEITKTMQQLQKIRFACDGNRRRYVTQRPSLGSVQARGNMIW